MLRARAAVLLIRCVGWSTLGVGCPSAPEFVGSDVQDVSTLDVAETEAPDVAATETVATETDEGETEVITDTEPEVEVRSCMLGESSECGPAAACDGGICRCVSADCSGLVAAQAGDEVALALVEVDKPVVAFTRFKSPGDLNVARYGMAFTQENHIADDGDGPLSMTLDNEGQVIALASTLTDAPNLVWQQGDDWIETEVTGPDCKYPNIAYDRLRNRAVVGCTDTDAAFFGLVVYTGPSAGAALTASVSIGKAPNRHRPDFALEPATSRVWVLYSQDKTTEATLHVANYDTEWKIEDLGPMTLQFSAPLGPLKDLALDALGRPHVVVIRKVGDAVVLTHNVRTGDDAWLAFDVATDIALDGVSKVELERGPGATMQLLVVRGKTLALVRFDNEVATFERELTAPIDVPSADLAIDAAGVPWVAYAEGRDSIRLWRPTGP